jgi:hypothetical protein
LIVATVSEIFVAEWRQWKGDFRCVLTLGEARQTWYSRSLRNAVGILVSWVNHLQPTAQPSGSGFQDPRPIILDLGSLPIDRLGVLKLTIRRLSVPVPSWVGGGPDLEYEWSMVLEPEALGVVASVGEPWELVRNFHSLGGAILGVAETFTMGYRQEQSVAKQTP